MKNLLLKKIISATIAVFSLFPVFNSCAATDPPKQITIAFIGEPGIDKTKIFKDFLEYLVDQGALPTDCSVPLDNLSADEDQFDKVPLDFSNLPHIFCVDLMSVNMENEPKMAVRVWYISECETQNDLISKILKIADMVTIFVKNVEQISYWFEKCREGNFNAKIIVTLDISGPSSEQPIRSQLGQKRKEFENCLGIFKVDLQHKHCRWYFSEHLYQLALRVAEPSLYITTTVKDSRLPKKPIVGGSFIVAGMSVVALITVALISRRNNKKNQGRNRTQL
ncbi:MAG: hypothetical protein LBK29_03390 [Oscillospiraceae bacterium]|jgi:hypothetical protein|nr:hypothetical protein [Oscillospiraceae bacterium]